MHPVRQLEHVLHVVAGGARGGDHLLRDLLRLGRPQPVARLGRGHEHQHGEGRVLAVRGVEERDLLDVAAQRHLPVVKVVEGLLAGELHGHAVRVAASFLYERCHAAGAARGAAVGLVALPEPPREPVDLAHQDAAVLEPRLPHQGPVPEHPEVC